MKNKDKIFIDWLKREYYNDIINTYNEYVLVNVENISSVENDLLKFDEYIPILISEWFNQSYFHHLYEHDSLKKYVAQLRISRHSSYETNIKELINWIHEHPQYREIFNKKAYDALQKELKEKDKQYSQFKKSILK